MQKKQPQNNWKRALVEQKKKKNQGCMDGLDRWVG